MMKTLKYIVLLTVMLVNVTPSIKDGKVEWKANEAAAQYYTVEYDFDTFTYYCHDFNSNNPALYLFQSVAQYEALNNIDPFSFGSIINDYAGTINLLKFRKYNLGCLC